MIFDVYAFADYSGATAPRQQKKSIVLAKWEPGTGGVMETAHFTRDELVMEMQEMLATTWQAGKRVICGFDHSYSFPMGFYETVTDEAWTHWDQLLRLLAQGTAELPPVEGLARQWAESANRFLGQRFDVESGGPFWGPNFSQRFDPKFPFAETSLQERRLVEEGCRKMKPIYKIGGIGTVGLQALYGIRNLEKVRSYCHEREIPLFCWPFDGWELPEQGHVLVEVYPTLYNDRERTDTEDAMACVRWIAEQDRAGKLLKWFDIELTAKERQRASLEGWVLGVGEQKE